MKIEYTEDLVRQLKGAPISVLVLLMINRQPVSAQYIERWTGYSDKLVFSALQLLNEKSLITRNGRYAWQISDAAMQLPLANLLPDSQGDDSAPEPASQENSDATRKIRHGNSPTPSSSRSLNQDLPELEVKGQPPLEQLDTEFLRVSENLAACDAAGIREPKRSALSQMPDVFPALIRYHTQTAPTIGAAIYRVEHGWRIKSGWVDQTVCAQTVVEYCTPAENKDRPILPPEAVQAWENAKAALEKRLRRVDFETWIVPAMLDDYDSERGYTVRACNSAGGQWLVEHALERLRAELSAPVEVVWTGKETK